MTRERALRREKYTPGAEPHAPSCTEEVVDPENLLFVNVRRGSSLGLGRG